MIIAVNGLAEAVEGSLEFFSGKLQIYAHKPCFALAPRLRPLLLGPGRKLSFHPHYRKTGALSLPKFLLERNLPLPPHKFRSIAAVRFPRSFGSGRRMTSLLSLSPSFDFRLPFPSVRRPHERAPFADQMKR